MADITTHDLIGHVMGAETTGTNAKILILARAGNIMSGLILAGIPQELKQNKSFTMWNRIPIQDTKGNPILNKDGTPKMAKVPYQINGQRARPNDISTCETFDRCKLVYEQGGYAGIGYLFTKEDPYIFCDWDHVIEDGVIDSEALAEIFSLGSYAEISQSGTGVHVIMRGIKPGIACRYLLEMYDGVRFVALTGNHIKGTPTDIQEAPQAAIDKLYYDKVLNPKASQKATQTTRCTRTPSPNTDDYQIIQLCRKAGNGAKFRALFAGDISQYRSNSEADLALCNIMAYYTQDEAQLHRLFEISGLNRKEWDHKSDRTIRKSLNGLRRTYQGNGNMLPHGGNADE